MTPVIRLLQQLTDRATAGFTDKTQSSIITATALP